MNSDENRNIELLTPPKLKVELKYLFSAIETIEKRENKMLTHIDSQRARETMILTKNAVKSFSIAKQLCVTTERINAIDFSPNGETLISSDNNEQIIFYDCDRSDQLKTINVRKYGVDLVRYTRDTNHFIHTSTKIDHSIRHMNMDMVTYLEYYRGHTDRVVSLCMSPNDEKFLSGSLDRTLRLWDLRSNECKGIMNVSGRPIAAFDPEGRTFAVGINSASVKLYDIRKYEVGPFVTFKMDNEKTSEWIDMKFSPDGKVIMINTNGPVIRLIDAYDGTALQTISSKFRFWRGVDVV